MKLTPIEQQTIQMVAQGWSNKEIADARKVTESTVKHQISTVFNKLGFSNRVELAAWQLKREFDAVHQ